MNIASRRLVHTAAAAAASSSFKRAAAGRRHAAIHRVLRPRSFSNYPPQHVEFFKGLVGADHAVTSSEDPALLLAHSTDWIRRWAPKEGQGAQLLLRPGSEAEVAAIVSYAYEHGLPLVPQGGNTGLVGGSTPTGPGEFVLSLARLNKIHRLDKEEGVIECGAGCILEALDNAAREHGFEMPLDLGAKGSCQIGGNLATHAGGVRFVRHGPLKAYVLKLHVVDGTGRELVLGSDMRKDNTGFDLKSLFVGSEGCLGVITRATISLPRCFGALSTDGPKVAMIAVPTFAAAATLARRAKAKLGESLSALEWMDGAVARHVVTYNQSSGGGGGGAGGGAKPFESFGAAEQPEEEGVASGDMARFEDEDVASGQRMEGFLLVECSGAVSEHDEQRINAFLEECFEEEEEEEEEESEEEGGSGSAVQEEGEEVAATTLATDAVVAGSSSQAAALWALREGCGVALTARFHAYKYDVSLPLRHFPRVIAATKARLAAKGLLGPATSAREPSTSGVGADAEEEAAKHKLAEVVCWGHMGDGNLHINVVCGVASSEVEEALEPWLFEWVAERGGSISAEHGVGRCKRDLLGLSRSPDVLAAMAQLKHVFDPKGIMNPGKMLPSEFDAMSPPRR